MPAAVSAQTFNTILWNILTQPFMPESQHHAEGSRDIIFLESLLSSCGEKPLNLAKTVWILKLSAQCSYVEDFHPDLDQMESPKCVNLKLNYTARDESSVTYLKFELLHFDLPLAQHVMDLLQPVTLLWRKSHW